MNMKREIWIQSTQPDWKKWKKLGSLKLREAIFLSMDICPIWYQDDVLARINNFNDQSEYRHQDLLENIEVRKEIYEAVEAEFSERLKIVKSWFAKQDWIVGDQPLVPDGITTDSYVDLEKFIPFAFSRMGFKNEIDGIPEFGSSINSDNLASASEGKKTLDWMILAKKIGEEYLEDYGISSGVTDKTLTQVGNYVAGKLNDLGMRNLKGGQFKGESITRDCLGGEWWQAMVKKGKTLPK